MNTQIEQLVIQRTIARDKIICLLRSLESYARIRRKLHEEKNQPNADVRKIKSRLESVSALLARTKNDLILIKESVPKTDFFNVNSKSEYKSGLTELQLLTK